VGGGEGQDGFQWHGDLDRLIHEPARLAIMSLLRVVDAADFVFLQDRTGLTGGNLGSHMSRLEEAGYVDVEKRFVERKPQTVYQLTERGRVAFERYRERMASVLGDAGR
jgi:DNA-binding transcriptional ArsR family regulator